jgi:hypothetical protein
MSAFLSGCISNDIYFKQSKSKSVKLRSYPQNQILIRNFAIYNSREERSLIPNNEPFLIDKDSLSQVILRSLQELGIKSLKIVNGENIIDSTLYKKTVINIGRIDEQYLRKLAGNTSNQTVLIPVINAINRFAFTGFISSGGISGDSGFYFITWLDLIVYIIRDDQIIYSRHISYKSDQVWANSRAEILDVPPLAAVKQEHWDELVRLAMKDYIKRLK